MAGLIEYVFDAAGVCHHVYEWDGAKTYSLNQANVLWVWESCGWREPTEEERQAHMATLIDARNHAPRLQASVYIPVVSNG